MKREIIKLDGMDIDVTEVRSMFDCDGMPVWSGKVGIAFRTGEVVTANWVGTEFATGELVDFEGDADESDPLYTACELYAPDWATEIARYLGRPSMWDARRYAQEYTKTTLGDSFVDVYELRGLYSA